MPDPAVLTAAKLVRANNNDIGDIVWWIRHRNLKKNKIEQAIENFPDRADRKTAKENIVFVELVIPEV